MTAADRLNEIEARANAATDGVRLERYRHGGGRLANFSMNSDRELVADFYGEADREFYTAARTDVPALVAALRAVLELAYRWATQSTDYDEDTEQQIDDGKAIVRAIEEALS